MFENAMITTDNCSSGYLIQAWQSYIRAKKRESWQVEGRVVRSMCMNLGRLMTDGQSS